MRARDSLVIVILAATTVSAQHAAPAPTGLEDARFRQLVDAYEHGRAEAAVEELSRRPDGWAPVDGGGNPAQETAIVTTLSGALLLTESGMRKSTFGKYARSAPLTPAPESVGLNGRFELGSLVSYRAIRQIVGLPPLEGDARTNLVPSWYVVSVSYCWRWRLDCGDRLLAAAREDLENDPAMLLLSGADAERRGAYARAVTLLQRAVWTDPTLVEARVRLGHVLAATGQTTRARTELERAVVDGRIAHQRFSQYYGLVFLAELDERAGRTASAAARRRTVSALAPYDDATTRWIAGLDPSALYAAAEFWEIPARTAEWRRAVQMNDRLTPR